MENIQKPMMEFSIFQIREDWVDLKDNWSKI